MLHSGGRVLDDIKEIRMDEALKTILKIDNIPYMIVNNLRVHQTKLVKAWGLKNRWDLETTLRLLLRIGF